MRIFNLGMRKRPTRASELKPMPSESVPGYSNGRAGHVSAGESITLTKSTRPRRRRANWPTSGADKGRWSSPSSRPPVAAGWAALAFAVRRQSLRDDYPAPDHSARRRATDQSGRGRRGSRGPGDRRTGNRRAQMAQRRLAARAQGRRDYRRGCHRRAPESRLRAARHRPQYQSRRRDIPPDLRDKATSIVSRPGHPCDRIAIADSLFNLLDSRYMETLTRGFDAVRPAWERFSALTGRRIVRLWTAIGVRRDV